MIKLAKKFPMIFSAIFSIFIIVLSFKFPSYAFYFMLTLIVLFFVLALVRVNFKVMFTLFCVIVVGISMLSALNHISSINKRVNFTTKGEFIVTSKPYCHGEDYYSFTVKNKNANGIEKGEKILVGYNGDKADELQFGDIITIDAKIENMADRYNRLNFYSNGIFLQTYIYDFEIIEIAGDKLYSFIGNLRGYISEYLFSYLSYDEAATLCALTSSDRSFMSDFFYGCVKASGVAHVMVVSGMHLSIVMNFVTKISQKFFYNKYLKAFIIVLTVIFMSVLCGFSASILRAGVTYLFMALSFIVDRPNTTCNNLGSAVTLLLIFTPLLIFNVGFILSVLSTFGVLVVAPRFTEILKKTFKSGKKITGYILENTALSISATVMTLPVLVYYFGYISIVGIITNLLISAFVTYALIVAAIALLVNLLSPLISQVVLLPAAIITKYINTVIVFFGTLPFATVDTPRYLTVICIIILILTLILLLACNYRVSVLKLNKMKAKILSETEAK